MAYTVLTKCYAFFVFWYLLVSQASTNPVIMESFVPEPHNSSQKLGDNAESQTIINRVQQEIETQITLTKNETERTLQVLNETIEQMRALVTTYKETVHNQTAPVLNDYHVTRELAISMQPGINVAECNEIIRPLEGFVTDANNYSRDQIANIVIDGVQAAKYINDITVQLIEALNTYKERFLECNIPGNATAALICADEYTEQASSIRDNADLQISKSVHQLEPLKEIIKTYLNKALVTVPKFHNSAKILIPRARKCIEDKIAETRQTKYVTRIIGDPAKATTQAVPEAVIKNCVK